jgi:hypothetical protein
MGNLGPARPFKDLPPDRIIAIGRALTRGSKGAKFLGEKASESEQDLIGWFRGERFGAMFERVAQRNKFKLSPAGRRRLWELVRKALDPVLGGVPERNSYSTWEYRTDIGHWAIYTEVELHSGGDWHLTYSHTVCGELAAAKFVSLLSCMGLHSQTLWTLESEDTFPASAQGIALACDRFLHGEPRIFL